MPKEIASFRPSNNYVLIRRKEEKSEGKILTPDIAKTPSNRGIVIAVGEFGYRTDIPPKLKPGDWVEFTKFGAMDIEVGGETLALVRYPEVYGTYVGG